MSLLTEKCRFCDRNSTFASSYFEIHVTYKRESSEQDIHFSAVLL